MGDRRRITTVDGLGEIHANYRDTLRPFTRHRLLFDVIWPSLIVDALTLVKPAELVRALVEAGVDKGTADHIATVLAARGLADDTPDEGPLS